MRRVSRLGSQLESRLVVNWDCESVVESKDWAPLSSFPHAAERESSGSEFSPTLYFQPLNKSRWTSVKLRPEETMRGQRHSPNN